MANVTICLALGLTAGILSGLVGIGGGVIVIPALIYFLGFSQHQAQGTTLAFMIPPIGLLAAWAYWKQGYVDIKTAALLCAGFFIGGFFGAKLAVGLPQNLLQKIFGIVLFFISLKMILGRP